MSRDPDELSASAADVLAGRRSYDSVDDQAQAEVRARWAAAISDRLDRLDMAVVLAGQGRDSWVVADTTGRPRVVRQD